MISIADRILCTLWLLRSKQGNEAKIDGASYELLYVLFPQSSATSIRVAVSSLSEQKLINTYSVGGKAQLQLSQAGKDRLQRQFSALFRKADPVDAGWTIVAFGEAVAADPHFRKTSQVLLSYGFFPYAKGVYLYAGKVPSSCKSTLDTLKTSTALLMMTSKSFIFGDGVSALFRRDETQLLVRRKRQIDESLSRLRASIERSSTSRFPQTSQTYQKILELFLEAGLQSLFIPEKYLLNNMRLYTSLEQFQSIAVRYFLKILTHKK